MMTLRERIDYRLNNCLCEMDPDYDDSITGFNQAWDIVRKTFDEIEPGDAGLRASHDRLLAAAKASLDVWENMYGGIVSPYKLENAINSCKAAIELAP